MVGPKENYSWQTQKQAKDCASIECGAYDPYRDFKPDKSGYYVLIRPNFATYRIELAICNKKHEIEKVFNGRSPQDIYHTVLNHQQQHKLNWISDGSHWAYIGKELKKAEIALATGNNAYFQE